MRFLFLVSLFLMLAVGPAGADEPTLPPPNVEPVVSSNIKFLLLGGLTITDAWYTINSFVVGPRYGYRLTGGPALEIEFSDRVSLSIGGSYESRTIGVNQDGTLVYMSRDTILVPLLAKLTVLPLVSVMAGAYGGFAVGRWRYEPQNPPRPIDAGKIDVGFALGLEGRYPLSFSKHHLLSLVGQLLYFQGLTNIASSPLEDFRYREFHFLAGISLAL